MFVAGASATIGVLIAVIYAGYFDHLHIVPPGLARQAPWAVILIGLGTLLRLFSDTSGALLQKRGAENCGLDNILLASERYFLGRDDDRDVSLAGPFDGIDHLRHGGWFVGSDTFHGRCAAERHALAAAHHFGAGIDRATAIIIRIARVVGAACRVLLRADRLHPHQPFLRPEAASGRLCAFGVQIDLGLLMLVTGLAAVLLPKSALAHVAGAPELVRRYYLRGTLASTSLLLTAASAGIWVFYPLIFRIWFGPHPPNTRPILDLILIGTVIGGSSCGRVTASVLIGMGKIKPFTIAAIIAGVANAIASFCFVKYTRKISGCGILYGTLIAVVGRCGLWMPWYVLKTLRNENGPDDDVALGWESASACHNLAKRPAILPAILSCGDDQPSCPWPSPDRPAPPSSIRRD